MDQYMDSYGDNITIGSLGKIAFYRVQFFFLPCGSEIKVCARDEVEVCVCSELNVFDHLSMNESNECACVQI